MQTNNNYSTQRELEEFCSKYGTFTQSAMWAKVKSGWEAEYITAKDENGKICGSMLLLIKRLPLSKVYVYAPRGPVCDMSNLSVLSDLINQAVAVAKKHKAFMLRVDPMVSENDYVAIENLKKLGFIHHSQRVGYENVQCRENYVLDIKGKSEEEVFASFKSKWRYNIRLATNRGVKCDFYGEEKLDDFMMLMKQTAQRDGFQYRGREYFETVLRELGDKAKLCMCYLDDEPLSGALCIDYAGVMSYVYGCSSCEHRNCMPNHLMQWTMIKDAIANNCHTYDFCGIPYWNVEEHKNYGVYRFKKGFNGNVITYAGEFDYRFNPLMCRMFDMMRLKSFAPAKVMKKVAAMFAPRKRYSLGTN